jgi:hypothetical protein
MRPCRLVLLPALLILSSVPSPAWSQGTPCTDAEHRAFDFWAGSWEVRIPDGRLAGHNTIEVSLNGCVLHEHYTTPKGYEGESFNVFDASRGVWHQTWVDNGGALLTLEGAFDGEKMVLEGTTQDAAGAVTLQRITWSRVDGDPDRVRQLWEASSDSGSTWTVAFDGLYIRMSQETPAY